MKQLKLSWLWLFSALMISGGVFIGCQKDAASPDVTSNAKGKGVTNTCGGEYTVNATRTAGNKVPSCNAYTGTSSTFEWTVTFPKGTQDVSHFSVILDECVDFTDILAVYYTDNISGATTCLSVSDFTYVIDKSLGCTNIAVAKFDVGGKSGQITYGIVLRGSYQMVTGNTKVFVKSGSKSGCCEITTDGPGCPEDYGTSCNLSQGFWFRAPHSEWCEEVVLGRNSFDKEEGQAIWSTSNKGGITAAKRGFAQYSAIYLDQACQDLELTQEVLDAMATIVSIMGTTVITAENIQTLNYGPTDNARLVAAASTISDFINLSEQNCTKTD